VPKVKLAGLFPLRSPPAVAEEGRPRGDITFVERCRQEAARLRQNIEQNGWDGEWYRRAYFDDGSPLGSANHSECQIDSIA
jgi:cyclic beta-1,2-glucan synthetase